MERMDKIFTVKNIKMQDEKRYDQIRDREGGDDALASNTSREEGTPIYLTPDSTLQTPDEDRRDKEKDPRDSDTLSVSNDDLRTSDADRFAGSDRAGTSERKDNSRDNES